MACCDFFICLFGANVEQYAEDRISIPFPPASPHCPPHYPPGNCMLDRISICFTLFVLSSVCLSSDSNCLAEESSHRGEELFRQTCADCHGDLGEGVDGAYEKSLTGDATLGELSRVIAETMPEGDPESCVGEDADAVAKYIYDAFYSPAAQLRLNPPRQRLARLTGPQLRQSLADLFARFDGATEFTDEYGIQARYYNRERKERVEFERIDSTIDFDFGMDGPGEGVDAENWAARWNGALKVDVTGRYQIIVRSTCSFVMKFGGNDREFINNHVQSGDRTEFRKSIHLTAGRVYPLSIQFDQRKRKTEQPPARITLSWKPPHGVEQVIPARAFPKVSARSAFALQTKLPPDDRSYGYERGIAVDRQWDESTTAAAIEFADAAVEELWPRYRRQHRDESNEGRAQLRQFLLELVETAFRGPISEEVRRIYVDEQIDATDDDNEAIRRVVLIALKSPRFLYPMLDGDRSPAQRAANRLALTLFDSLPSDRWLRKAVEDEKLLEEREIRTAARRMVRDWRTRGKTRQLFYEWLNLEHFGEIAKNEDRFPEFDELLVSDLRASLDLFLDEVVWGESSDFRQLFLSNVSFTSDRIREYYGEDWSSAVDAPGLQPTKPVDERMFGVLSHPYMMSGLAYRDSTSPIHRGVFLLRYVLGRTLRPPNEAFTPLSPDLHPEMTTRERVTLQTSPANCQVCHQKINGLGFALENFDAVGRYRTEENGRVIDAEGRYNTRADDDLQFVGPAQLASMLAESEDVQRAFVNRAFQHFVKQPPAAYGADTEDRLLKSFIKSEYDIRKLLVEIAVTAASVPQDDDSIESALDPS